MKYSNRHRISVILILLLISVGLFYGSYLYSGGVLNVSEIQVKDQSGKNLRDIEENLKLFISDKNITDVNEESLQTVFNENFREYKFISMSRGLSKEVKIQVVKREPSLYIQAQNGTFVSDEDGYVFGNVDQQNKKYLKTDSSVKLGDHLDQDIQNIKYYDEVNTQLRYEKGMLFLVLNNGIKILLPISRNQEDANKIMSLLQKIIQKYTIEDDGIGTIDLRFSKPVIKYK